MGAAHNETDLHTVIHHDQHLLLPLNIQYNTWSCCVQKFDATDGTVNSLAHAHVINHTVANAAQCQALVQSLYPQANGAQYSNTSGVECKAIFNACVCIVSTPQLLRCQLYA